MIDQPLLTSSDDGDAAVRAIAEQVLRDAFTFAALAPESGLTEERFAPFGPRAQVGVTILRFLEAVTDLRFAPVPVPFVLNLVHWRGDLPASGHLDDGGPMPLPSEVLVSLTGALRLSSEGSVPVRRPLSAVLDAEARGGFVGGIAMLADLYRFGFVTRLSTVREVLDVVLADAGAPTPDRLASLVDGYEQGWTAAQWGPAQIRDRPRHHGDVGEGAARALEVAATRALIEVAALRRSSSWDEWVVRSATARRMALLVRDLLARTKAADRPVGPALETVASQIEEIGADAYVTSEYARKLLAAGALTSQPAIGDLVAFGRSVATMASSPRIRRQRVFLDDVLGDLDPDDLPERWRAHSWRVGTPALEAFGCPVPTVFAVAEPGPEPVDPAAHLAQVRAIAARTDADPGGVVAELRGLQAAWPLSPFVRWELGVALGGLGRHEESLAVLTEALGIAWSFGPLWQSLEVELAALGAAREAVVARFVAQELAKRERPSG